MVSSPARSMATTVCSRYFLHSSTTSEDQPVGEMPAGPLAAAWRRKTSHPTHPCLPRKAEGPGSCLSGLTPQPSRPQCPLLAEWTPPAAAQGHRDAFAKAPREKHQGAGPGLSKGQVAVLSLDPRHPPQLSRGDGGPHRLTFKPKM